MNVFAVVPVKGLDVSKRRLSKMLAPENRRTLTTAMLEEVLNVLKASSIREVLVVSPDSEVRQIADKFGFSCLSPQQVGLNAALKEAVAWCMQKKADAVLILPADVPLISSEDIDRLVELGSEESTVVLSPSMSGGTNALFLNPPNLIQPCFGPDSFFSHVEEALRKNIAIKFHSSREIMLDIDSEEDLNKLLELEDAVGHKRVFAQSKILKKPGE
jgi:2-phospho-L-lactate guanylyltransferase